MKFARLLRATAFEGMPQMETLFSAYKSLKKKIKKLPPKQEQQGEQQGQQQHPPGTLTNEETEFVQALSDTLNQLNDVYIEKEETSVIRVERLESELATATTPEQLNELHKQFVDFHGEVLLLVHWSILAYTATVKILKKHHKRTGLLVKAPELGNLLSQPFCSTELMTSIARRVEEDIQRLSERMGLPTQRASEPTQQARTQPAQQGSEPLGTPSTTGVAAMAAAAAMAVAAAAACSDNGAADLPALTAPGLSGAAAAAAAAAAGGVTAGTAAAAAGAVPGAVPEVAEYGLDLQLLRQLAADSGSQTSRSDDESAEQDTCASKQQQQQPCSQQANVQQPAGADDDHAEVQSAPKKRRPNPSEPAAAAMAAAAAAEAIAAAGAEGAGGQNSPVQAADAAAGVQAGLGDNATQAASAQPWQREQAASPPAATADVMLTHMCPSSAEHRVSCTGTNPPLQQSPGQEQQQEAHALQDQHMAEAGVADAAAAGTTGAQQGMGAVGNAGMVDAGDDAAGGPCAREASIMRQTQVALTTWRHLQSTASTPSTVMQGSAQPACHATETALTASSAVQ